MSLKPEQVPQFTLNNGTKIPCIGLGTFGSDRVSAEDVANAVDGAIKVGYRLIDCASAYGNEKEIGEVLQKNFKDGTVKREDLIVMSKLWNDKHREVEASCDKTLKDLQLDYLDVYFIHWPFPNYHAPFCDVDARNPDSKPFSIAEFMDTYRQMEALVKKGKIRAIGISNLTIPKMEQVLDLMEIKPVACETEFHPCLQQQEIFDYLVAHGIQPIGFMPLGSPRRPERDIVETDIEDMKEPELVAIAKAHNCHPATICLKWAIQRGQLPIPFSIHNYEGNLESTVTEPLTDEEMKTIAGLEKNNRLVKGQVFLWPGAKDWHDLWDEDGFIVDCPDAK